MLRTARWVTGSFLRDGWLFVFLWAWMAQLLIPFGEATAIPSMKPFLFFLALLFLIDLMVGNAIGRFVIKWLILSLFIFTEYFTQYGMFEFTWVKHWFVDCLFTVQAAFSSKLILLPESARTTGFLITLWMLQSLYRQSLLRRVWMFVFLVLGMVGLGILDVFFVEDASTQIVLFFFLGLMILAFLQLPTIERVARMPRRLKGWPMEWVIWTVAMSLVVSTVATVVPKTDKPSWPDPVAFLQGKSAGAFGRGVQKIGYGTDDAHLGGPFEMDDTVLFTVATSTESYYRGESKATYSGKGWVSGSPGLPLASDAYANLQDQERFDTSNVDTKRIEQVYTFKEDAAPVIFSQYRLTGITGMSMSQEGMKFSSVDMRVDVGELKAGDSYKVVSEVPYYEETKLKSASVPTEGRRMSAYLNLPVTLPERIGELARDITKDAKTPYERAQALELYLRNNYRYETKDVPVPKENQDFVDQFLFESKRGYCDHFSSSMVIMARSLGMPARWVKGFTKGDADLTYRNENNSDEYLYVVKNRNAHSWPEIYFEGVGWVAFEPTSTFLMPHLYKEDQAALAPLPEPKVEKSKDKEEEEEQATNNDSGFVINWAAFGEVLLALAAVGLVFAVIFRRRLLLAYYLRRGYKSDEDVVMNALSRLFVILNKLGWKRRDDMTLREYAQYLSGDPFMRGREMVPLAAISERVFYGKSKVSDRERGQIRDLWTRIIRKAGRMKRK